MSMAFDNVVSSIADEFISSILFVDEKAFSPSRSIEAGDKATDLDVEAVSKAFINAGKICGFFAPKSVADIERCKQLVLKPDIIVLDWDIVIKSEAPITKEEELEDDLNDDRGHYSLKLLKAIVEDARDAKLKVVFIYTGEPEINNILSEIADSLGDSFCKIEENYEVSSNNVHVIVRLKPDSKVTLAGFDSFKVSYERLPNVVIDSFAKYVRGLMPCFAMKTLSTIRDSAAKVLRVYNKELDPELLGHQMALHDPNDVKSYLANSFGTAISELIMSANEINTDLWAKDWIESRYLSDRTINLVEQKINATASSVSSFFDKRFENGNARERVNSVFSVNCSNNKEKKLISKLSSIFHLEGDDVNKARFEFAALSQNKNLFAPSSVIPQLTLGTIVYRRCQDEYYLCIQQRCDASRVPKEGMRFLFLPLYKNQPHNMFGAISIEPSTILYLKESSSNFLSFMFVPEAELQPIKAQRGENSELIFKSGDDVFEWKGELKDILAQRIVTAFSSHFARVAVDEAEWLRVEGAGE